jgi:hypothetical protein
MFPLTMLLSLIKVSQLKFIRLNARLKNNRSSCNGKQLWLDGSLFNSSIFHATTAIRITQGQKCGYSQNSNVMSVFFTMISNKNGTFSTLKSCKTLFELNCSNVLAPWDRGGLSDLTYLQNGH